MVHAPTSTQYKAFTAFSLMGCLKVLLCDIHARNSRFQEQDHFLVIMSRIKVAEQRLIKKLLSYNVHYNNNKERKNILKMNKEVGMLLPKKELIQVDQGKVIIIMRIYIC